MSTAMAKGTWGGMAASSVRYSSIEPNPTATGSASSVDRGCRSKGVRRGPGQAYLTGSRSKRRHVCQERYRPLPRELARRDRRRGHVSGNGRSEPQSERAEVYRRLAAVESIHASHWVQRLADLGAPLREPRPTWRTRLLILIAKQFGPGVVLPTLRTLEEIDRDHYDDQPESRDTAMPAQERSHARVLRQLTGAVRTTWDGAAYSRFEGRHGAGGGNALRAAVLGANDGLVSNLSLVMGVAGAAFSNHTVLVTGLAGLVAGACSMAMGEWLSVQSSRELYQKQIATEADELAQVPDEEQEELVLIYQSKGMDRATAEDTAARVMANKDAALDTLVREEIGVNPDDLGGSAWSAALSSFSVVGIGAITSIFTGRSAVRTGLRQVAVGVAAAAVTYGLGRLLGVSLS